MIFGVLGDFAPKTPKSDVNNRHIAFEVSLWCCPLPSACSAKEIAAAFLRQGRLTLQQKEYLRRTFGKTIGGNIKPFPGKRGFPKQFTGGKFE